MTMIVKGELDELVDTLNDYSVYLKQFGYSTDTIFAAYAIMAASLSGKKINKNQTTDAIKERMKELSVVQTRISGTVH
jgi:phage-related minor tail protein|tara:strand:- start:1018 stop:1251 length:234 start_codon:yes stop_codon:yes gene_type:complete